MWIIIIIYKEGKILTIKFETSDGEEVKSGETVYIELEVPKKHNMPFGQFDKALSDLQKKGYVKSISKEIIEKR